MPDCSPLRSFAEQMDIAMNMSNPSWCCDWITCQAGLITKISLSYYDLSGTLPSFSNNTALKELSLSSNDLSGTLPSFSNNPALEWLGLWGNDLSGTLPSFSHNPALYQLDLYNNDLSGTLPSFSNNPALYRLDLYDNNLSGTLPSFSNNPALDWLSLYNNDLSGTLPSFSNNPALYQLDLYNNDLSGTLPLFSNNPALWVLYLYNNDLSGTLPLFSNNPRLRELDLSGNDLSGTLPSFSNLGLLEVLEISSNQLSGSLSKLAFPQKLSFTNISNNQVSGSLPKFAETDRLWVLNVSNNDFDCPLPVRDFDSTTFLLVECRYDWSLLAMCSSSVMGLAILLYLSFKRRCTAWLKSSPRFKKRLLVVSTLLTWGLGGFDLGSDISLLKHILTALEEIKNKRPPCNGITGETSFFGPILPHNYTTFANEYRYENFLEGSNNFLDYVERVQNSEFGNTSANGDIEYLKDFCTTGFKSSCQFNIRTYNCELKTNFFPHPIFEKFVWVSIALYGVKELFKVCSLLAVVCIFFGRKNSKEPSSTVLRLGYLGSKSVCAPFFAIILGWERFAEVCLHKASFLDSWLEAMYESVENIPQLYISVYYLQSVTEQNLSFAGLISVTITISSSCWLLLKVLSIVYNLRHKTVNNERKSSVEMASRI